MELLSPWSLAWLGLLGPLVLLYVLKRRRHRKVVASTMLWEAAMRDLRAERPWQRLRPHLSLLLQALALVAGAVALARPAGAGQVPAGARVAVVIDASASMAARDASGESRLERARREALAMARDLPPDAQMMIIAAGREPDVLSPPTRDRVVLERALEAVAVRGGRVDLEGAAALAAERVRSAPASRVVLFTDAALAGTVALDRDTPVEVRRVGEPAGNTAITALDARASPTPERPDRAEVFVRVARFGEAADVRVTASVDGGEPLGARVVRVEGGASASVVLSVELPPGADGRGALVRAAVETLSGGDALALDDVAVAPSPAARRLPVFLVGEAPASVRRVLASDREVELFATDLEALERRREEVALDGLFVYAGRTPAEPPAGDSVVVAPSGDSAMDAALGPAAAHPLVVSWEEGDARMRFVRFTGVHLGAVRPVRAAAARALLTTDAGPAIAALERPDGETTVVAFDPDAGDWPSHAGFVVFFRNLLERARARRAAGGVAPSALGEPLRVPAPDGSEVRVVTPEGHVRVARARGGVAVVEVPPEPGVYRARAGDRERFALRSLLDAEESDLSARATFVRHDGREATVIEEPIEHRESWPWLAALLLVALALEALWATRKGAAA